MKKIKKAQVGKSLEAKMKAAGKAKADSIQKGMKNRADSILKNYKSVAKAQGGKSVKPTSKTVTPTADSSAYFKARMNEDYESAARNMNSPKYSEQAFKRAKKSTDDFFRQGDKGKPGYDKNGFPVKKQRSGGKIAKKK